MLRITISIPSHFLFSKNDLFEVAKADILDEIAGLAYHKKIEPAEWSVVCFIKNTDIHFKIFGGK